MRRREQGESVAPGVDEVFDACLPERRVDRTAAARQINGARAGGRESLCSVRGLGRVDLVGRTQAGELRAAGAKRRDQLISPGKGLALGCLAPPPPAKLLVQ